MEKVRADGRVTLRLGEPIQQKELLVFNYDRGARSAFRLRIKGSHGEANVDAQSVKERGNWRVERLEVVFSDGQSLDLLIPPHVPPLQELTR
jgi:hypothetical protein